MSTEVSKPIEVAVVYDLQHPDRLPDLNKKGQAVPIELTSNYWSPDEVGDSIRGFYQGIESSEYEDRKTGEMIELPCVRIMIQDKAGNISNIRNGSIRLVSSIQENVERGRIQVGSAIQITYMGTKKNKKNENISAQWSIKTVFVNE